MKKFKIDVWAHEVYVIEAEDEDWAYQEAMERGEHRQPLEINIEEISGKNLKLGVYTLGEDSQQTLDDLDRLDSFPVENKKLNFEESRIQRVEPYEGEDNE